ncbi:hypothetical protein EJ03DRAFT_327340, partial [Teratosphaeria nubilosa]
MVLSSIYHLTPHSPDECDQTTTHSSRLLSSKPQPTTNNTIPANSNLLFHRALRLHHRRRHHHLPPPTNPTEPFTIILLTTNRYEMYPRHAPETGYYASVIYHDGTQYRTAAQGPIERSMGGALEGLLDLTAVCLEGRNVREERFCSFPATADLWRGEGRGVVDLDLL